MIFVTFEPFLLIFQSETQRCQRLYHSVAVYQIREKTKAFSLEPVKSWDVKAAAKMLAELV